MASVVAKPAPTAAPISSLKYGKCHWSVDSTTPSREMKKFDLILRMRGLLGLAGVVTGIRPGSCAESGASQAQPDHVASRRLQRGRSLSLLQGVKCAGEE